MAYDFRPSLPETGNVKHAAASCSLCPAANSCIVNGVTAVDLTHWSQARFGHVPLTAAGKALFEAGDVADAVYVVRAGCIKTFTVDQGGHERVRGFHFPGDIIGLDALGVNRYPAAATAVVPSQLCCVPRVALQGALSRSPLLMQRLLERTSRDLALSLALSGDYSAEQRVAAFVLNMQDRTAVAGWTAPVKLSMTRRDIANYLRLATETVCRTLTRFEQQGLLRVQDKTVLILNAAALYTHARPVGIVRSRQALPLAA